MINLSLLHTCVFIRFITYLCLCPCPVSRADIVDNHFSVQNRDVSSVINVSPHYSNILIAENTNVSLKNTF